MDDLKKLARIIIICVALYILIPVVMGLFNFLFNLFFVDSYWEFFNLGPLLHIAFMIVYPLLIIYFFIYKNDFFAEKIAGFEEPKKAQVWWLPFSFRLTAVLAGIFYLYWLVPTIIKAFQEFLIARQHDFESPYNELSFGKVLGWVALGAIGVYLLCGAPHFVRWQVRKTIEQCKRIEEIREEAAA